MWWIASLRDVLSKHLYGIRLSFQVEKNLFLYKKSLCPSDISPYERETNLKFPNFFLFCPSDSVHWTALEIIKYFTSFMLYVSADGQYNSRIRYIFNIKNLLVVEYACDFLFFILILWTEHCWYELWLWYCLLVQLRLSLMAEIDEAIMDEVDEILRVRLMELTLLLLLL
jgi:hypothetical protein